MSTCGIHRDVSAHASRCNVTIAKIFSRCHSACCRLRHLIWIAAHAADWCVVAMCHLGNPFRAVDGCCGRMLPSHICLWSDLRRGAAQAQLCLPRNVFNATLHAQLSPEPAPAVSLMPTSAPTPAPAAWLTSVTLSALGTTGVPAVPVMLPRFHALLESSSGFTWWHAC